jgi:hypothetical protein
MEGKYLLIIFPMLAIALGLIVMTTNISSQVIVPPPIPYNGTLIGPQGPPGPQGLKGNTGNTGIQGIQGIQGLRGYNGTQGIQGIQGLRGYNGTQGIQGIQGLRGYNGTQGIQGIQGLRGYNGTQGIQGIQGLRGYNGTQGIQGIQGFNGTQGIQGIQGIQGFNGTQGIQGIQGIQGPNGVVNGTSASFVNVYATTYHNLPRLNLTKIPLGSSGYFLKGQGASDSIYALLSASDIPSLAASKITSGTFDTTYLNLTALSQNISFTSTQTVDGVDISALLLKTTKITDLGSIWDKTTKIATGDTDFANQAVKTTSAPTFVNTTLTNLFVDNIYLDKTNKDVRLYRLNTNILSTGTGDSLYIGGNYLLALAPDGIYFGSGSAWDVSLYRLAANYLQTDNNLIVRQNLYEAATLYFGDAGSNWDVALSRSSANVLSLGSGDSFGATTFSDDITVYNSATHGTIYFGSSQLSNIYADGTGFEFNKIVRAYNGISTAYNSGDYGVAWASYTPPSVIDFGQIAVAHNTNGAGSDRLYIYSGSAWHYVVLV